jgi:hypothetical protein
VRKTPVVKYKGEVRILEFDLNKIDEINKDESLLSFVTLKKGEKLQPTLKGSKLTLLKYQKA